MSKPIFFMNRSKYAENETLIDQNIGGLSNIVVNKQELLKILTENKEKHDTILETARAGYLEMAKQEINKKKEEFEAALDDYRKQFNFVIGNIEEKVNQNKINFVPVLAIKLHFRETLDLKYPKDYSKEYERAIRKVELNVYDKISLSEAEFECYVLNNWDWKDEFLTSNSPYTTAGANILRTSNLKARQLLDTGLDDYFGPKKQ